MSKNWLKQRIEILAKYAETLPTKQDRIQITFEYPDCGWMPVHFYKNGLDMGIIEFSDVDDCFEPLREWLETIATIVNDKASIINLEIEGWHVTLSYEPMWFYDHENYKGTMYPRNCGIFSVYDEAKDTFLLDAFCDTETFVRDVYKCIIDFAKAMKEKPEFIEDWAPSRWSHEIGCLDYDDPHRNEFFLNKVKSPSIQKFIRDCDLWHKNRNYFKRKERRAKKKIQRGEQILRNMESAVNGYYDSIVNGQDASKPSDFDYYCDILHAVSEDTYDIPIPREEMCIALAEAEEQGKRVSVEPDAQFLPDENGMIKYSQDDGWSYHTVIV